MDNHDKKNGDLIFEFAKERKRNYERHEKSAKEILDFFRSLPSRIRHVLHSIH